MPSCGGSVSSRSRLCPSGPSGRDCRVLGRVPTGLPLGPGWGDAGRDGSGPSSAVARGPGLGGGFSGGAWGLGLGNGLVMSRIFGGSRSMVMGSRRLSSGSTSSSGRPISSARSSTSSMAGSLGGRYFWSLSTPLNGRTLQTCAVNVRPAVSAGVISSSTSAGILVMRNGPIQASVNF